MHSPLVYALMDQGLKEMGERDAARFSYLDGAGNSWNGTELLQKIATHFGLREIKSVLQDGELLQFLARDRKALPDFSIGYDLTTLSLAKAFKFFKDHTDLIHEDDIVFVKGMHDSAAQLMVWRQWLEQPQLRLSLDFYSVGVLIFSKQIKEQQHFLLRPRAAIFP
ncbi:MAG: hypothetical protein JST36_08875 [Bacteroidetes bacterium]|nr:hypothetical protein [Bacteroidota bacterium]